MYSLNATSNFSSMAFVKLTNMSLVLVGSRVASMAVATASSGTAPMTQASTGTATGVNVTVNDNRRNLSTSAQYAIVPHYANTSATGGTLFSSAVTLYFLSSFKRELNQLL